MFFHSGGNYTKPNEFIEETNKGHQMLMKMGWSGAGAGLGSNNQGIDTPIAGGEVRDRQDMYKVGFLFLYFIKFLYKFFLPGSWC